MKPTRKRKAVANDQNSEKEWEVEKILNERPKRRKNPKTGKMEFIKEYQVKWIGYKNPSWEPEENLEHCKELLKDFLITQLMKTVKNKKSFQDTPKSDIANDQKIRISSARKVDNKKRNSSQKAPRSPKSDDPSTLSNCLTTNTISNKKRKSSRKKAKRDSSLTVIEEDENNYYDIEIVDDKDEEEDKNEISNIVPIKMPQNESSKKTKETAPIIQEKKSEKKNNTNFINVKDNEEVGKVSETIYYIDGIDEEEEDEDKIDIISGDADKMGIKKFNEFPYENVQKEKTCKFLERKRQNDFHENELNHKDIKILRINSMKIPERFEDNIKINVNYLKNNKIYVGDFDYDKLPKDYLIIYYNTLLKEYFAKGEYCQEVCFD